ncbi:hypothetical protein MMC09_001670 [Bachmanniomyces sp. S44760]|nr:hypothetical protein [Bachmanniomyces sp. S44760]
MNPTAVNHQDKNGMAPLHHAIKYALETELDEMALFLVDRKEVDVNLADEFGYTPLIIAISSKWNFTAAANGLIDRLISREDTNLNISDEGGRTPLHCAINNGVVKTALTLISRPDVKVNTVDKHTGRTPLMDSVQCHDSLVTQALLDRPEVSVNSADLLGSSALLHSIKSRRWEITALLLARQDIEINAYDNDDESPFSVALNDPDQMTVRLLLDHTNMKLEFESVSVIQIALRYALDWNDPDITRLLFVKVPSEMRAQAALVSFVLDWPWDQFTLKRINNCLLPLHGSAFRSGLDDAWHLLNDHMIAHKKSFQSILPRAAEHDLGKLVELILKIPGIEANLITEGETLLHLAIRHNHATIVSLLLRDVSIDVNRTNNGGLTPLLSSVIDCKPNEEISHMLLAHADIDVNCKNHSGSSPLHIAAKEGRERLAQMLLGHPSLKANVEDNYGDTPLVIAINENYEGVARLLIADRAVDVNRKCPLYRAIQLSQVNLVKYLFDTRGDEVDVNVKSVYGELPLLQACWLGNGDMISLLVARPDVDVNIEDTWGTTALSIAVGTRRTAFVRILMTRRDLRLSDTALGPSLVPWTSTKEDAEIAKLLHLRSNDPTFGTLIT